MSQIKGYSNYRALIWWQSQHKVIFLVFSTFFLNIGENNTIKKNEII